MPLITINNPLGKYYGIYFSDGWIQADSSNPPTHLAILKDNATEAGEHEGDIISPGETTFARTESRFNVKFSPVEEGFSTSTVKTENGATVVEGRAYEERFDNESIIDDRVIGWYK